MVSPAVEGLLADGASEDSLVISKKKLEDLLARLQRRIEEQNKEIERLHQLLELQEGRRSPPPLWVKPNVKKEGGESSHKRGAKKGHEAHHRPPPEKIHETKEVELDACPDCGGPLEGPFQWSEHTVESIIPGHVRITRWRIGRYRCRGCKKIRRAHIPHDVAPPKSNFSWGTHFLVGYWSLKGLTTSMLRDLLSSDYGLKVSVGEIDKMLARSARLFAPAYEAIRQALKEGTQVNADWTGWRVDGVNHNLWDFISPDVKAAFFRVDKSAGHEVPEGVLGKRRPKGQVLNCDGGVAFNAVHGKKQRCWVHLLRKAKQGQEGWERPSDAPDWRGLRVMEKLSRRILEVAKWPTGEEKTREAKRLMAWARRWLGVRREGTVALALQKYGSKHWDELWWWAEMGVDAHNNIAEQGLRPHIAVKRKLSWGSRTKKGADRTALLASVIQTGQLQGIAYRELGARVLKGEIPFQFGPGPPDPK
jgi:transposase